MEQGVSTTNNFKLPTWDGQKIGKVIIATAILAGLGYGFMLLLPYLLNIVWGTISLLIGGTIVVTLGLILTSKKFWRGMNYLTQGIARKTLGWVIEMDPFEILYEQVEAKEKDLESLKINGDKLRGQSSTLTQQLQDNDTVMHKSAVKMDIVNKKIANGNGTDDDGIQRDQAANDFNNAKDFIDSVTPILNGINTIIGVTDKAYKYGQASLINAKSTIKIQKAKFDAVTTGNKAMANAMAAFNGRTDLNNDADLALEKLRNDIGQKIGNMQTAIKISNDAMNHIDLDNAAKIEMSVQAAIKLQNDPTFTYSDSLGKNTNNMQLDTKQLAAGKGNQYLDYFETTKK